MDRKGYRVHSLGGEEAKFFSYYLVGQVGNEGELELLADYDEAPRGCTNAVVAQKLDWVQVVEIVDPG